MAAPSSEQRELQLVDKVELRIALADSDAKLEALLKTYLGPLLLKLASEHNSVRQKVVSVCQHISTRTKPSSIQLPVSALISQFKEQTSPLVRHFDLLYIRQGVDRLSSRQKAEILPILVSGIALSGTHGPQIFNLLLRLLEHITLPSRGSKDDVELRQTWHVTDEDADFLSGWLGKFILFSGQKGLVQQSPGLNAEDHAFLTLQGDTNVWDPSKGGLNLLRTKVLAARLLASGLFNDHERFFPALFASADPASNLSDVGDDMLKRALPATNLEDEAIVTRLFSLYFGEGGAARVRAPLRLKILGLLCKSTKSTIYADRIMKIVEDGVNPPSTDGEDTVMSNTPTTNSTGREATKLRAAVFQYINFVARHASPDTLRQLAQPVILKLREFIENQGWPKPGPNEDLVSRGYAYEVIGILANAGPREVLVEDQHPTMDLLRWLLESLARDSAGSSTVVSVEDALSTVLRALVKMSLSPVEQSVLEELLIHQVEQSDDLTAHQRLRSTRYIALRLANRTLPYASIKARWVDLLALGASQSRAEEREEAERGLSPYWYQMVNGSLAGASNKELAFPSFEAATSQILSSKGTKSQHEHDSAGHASVQRAKRKYPRSFQHMATFLRRILFYEALKADGKTPKLDSEWERRIDTAADNDHAARRAIQSYIANAYSKMPAEIGTLLSALYVAAVDSASGASSFQALVDFIALSPNSLVGRLAPDCKALSTEVRGRDDARRVPAAQAFGIICSHPSTNAFEAASIIDSMLQSADSWETASASAVHEVQGSILALAYYYSRMAERGQPPSTHQQFRLFIEKLHGVIMKSRERSVQEAAWTAIGQLSMFGALSGAAAIAQPRELIDKLYTGGKDGNETAILALGQVSMVLSDGSSDGANDLTYLIEQLHKLHDIRQAEVHFTVGEALSYSTSGWQSTALATKIDVVGATPTSSDRHETLARVTDRILADCSNTKPALKKAAVMWLLCLVQFCGHLPDLQSRLTKCQAAFKRCLGDRDELVQETASRGLGLLYEKGDRRLKDDLVRDLVSSFSSDRQSQLAGTVSADTQLFEPGALPTGDGSVSTYKDIMSLASEVGDSSLVYRFMSMASSNAIWTSRAAFGRFGLSNVLSDSSVDGYLANNPKLYPKLYRYRFDPNGGVQRSMNDIWNALVKDSTATIDKYFDDIMEDLLASILGKEWRVRQASCAALGDLVQGRPLERYEKYLERIWTQCFKVLDDIKESVRAAAASLARVLTGILTRSLESDHSSTKNATAMLKHVLPFLLSPSGMESSAQEVQAFAVHTLLEIIKKANGSTLRPFIPELVERLIGSLSSLEPEAVNYIHLNAAKYNLTEQKIDDMRLSSIRSSPLMEAIERCLDLLDDETMARFQPRLESAIKSAVGLPSKVGASRVLVSLSSRRLAVFRPHANASLKLIEKVVLDRNETVSSSYAVAAGYVARAATDEQILHLVSYCKKLYFESEGDRESSLPRRSLSAGELMYALSKHATDRFNAVAASVLPFIFVAKHDPNEQVKEQFQNAWNENVGGSRAVLLYLKEILGLSNTYLDSPQWAVKHTSARAVADAVTAVASLESEVSIETAQMVWPALERALGGKTWEGKEVVVEALAKFVESAKSFCQDGVKSTAIVKIATREAKRQNMAYKPHALRAFGRIALALKSANLFEPMLEAVKPVLESITDADAMDVDGGNATTKSSALQESTMAAAAESLCASVNPDVMGGQTLAQAVSTVITLVTSVSSPPAEVRRSIYSGLKSLFERVRATERTLDVDDATARGHLKTLLFSDEGGAEAVRLLRADAIGAMVQSSPSLGRAFSAEIRRLMEEEKSSPPVRDRLAAAEAKSTCIS